MLLSPHTVTDLLAIPEARRTAIAELRSALRPGMTVALSTHINADGDGCGSQTALARLLAQMDIKAFIVNPTPWPELFRWMLGDDVEDRTAKGAAALKGIDRLIVLDISDIGRLGVLADAVRAVIAMTVGAYSLVAISRDEPGRLVAARVGNAGGIVIGHGTVTRSLRSTHQSVPGVYPSGVFA